MQPVAVGWCLTLLIPLLCATAYEWITFRLYGRGLLFSAAGYASSVPQSIRGNILQQQVLGLEFLGGCFLPVLFYAPWLWSAKTLLKGLAVAVPCALLPFLVETHKRLLWEANGHLNWPMFLQSALFIAA